MITNNINFKGYENILCAYNVPTLDKNVTYIAMQLNDKDGVQDLSKYKQIRELQGYPIGSKNEDVIILTHVLDKINKTESLYLGTKEMYFGDELLQIEKNYIPKLMSEENYQKEKNIHMKIYTLLASLTRRMKYQGLASSNKDIRNVMESIYDTFCHLTKKNKTVFSEQEAFNILNTGCLKQIKFQEVAKGFNIAIKRTMKSYFK